MKTFNGISILFLFMFCINAYSQIKIDKDFYSYWLLQKYYDGLIQKTTPSMFDEKNEFIREICLPADSSIIMISNFYEAIISKYIPVSQNEIMIPDSIGFIKKSIRIKLIEENGKKFLRLKDNGIVFNYYALPKKYNSLDGLQKYMRDVFFTGKYYLNNSPKNIVTFQTDGKLHGIKKFNNFLIIVVPFDTPAKTNIVVLREIGVKNNLSKVFKWESKGNKIDLFEVDENNKIGKKVYTLTKIN
jgi:hypothetical protein